jgi:hypothetical protein
VTSATQGTFTATAAGFGLTGTAALTISAKPGSAADGAAGTGFHIATGDGTTVASLTVATATVSGVTTVTISYPAGLYTSGAQLQAALNGNAVFSSILVASGTGAFTATNGPTTVVAGVALTGGTTHYSISVVLSKPVIPDGSITTASNWTINVSPTQPPLFVVVNNLAQPSVATLIYTADLTHAPIVPGTTTVTFNGTTAVHDFAGNTMPSQTVTIS